MNEVEAALDPKKFVFIALDDEPEDVVERFLVRRRISSIVALDLNHETFSAFGVSSRPATIVIAPSGRVALVTEPMDLTTKELLAIANGEKAAPGANVSSKVISSVGSTGEHIAAETKTDAPNFDAPLAEVSLREKLPNERAYMFEHGSDGKQTFIGFDAKLLVGIALATPDRRVKYLNEMPSGNYDLTVNVGQVDEATKSAILTAIVEKAFKLKIKKSDSVQDVLVMKRAPNSSLKIQQTFDASSAHAVQRNGSEWAFSNFTMSQVASEIEDKYGVTVVDETGLAGGFDGVIHWPEIKSQLNDVLYNDLGLDLTPARRSVPTFTISKDN
jgi:uncharacterized protein (TIGR03435 family)